MVEQFVIEFERRTQRGTVAEHIVCTGRRETAETLSSIFNDRNTYTVGIRVFGGNLKPDFIQDCRAADVLESPDEWFGSRFEWVTV